MFSTCELLHVLRRKCFSVLQRRISLCTNSMPRMWSTHVPWVSSPSYSDNNKETNQNGETRASKSTDRSRSRSPLNSRVDNEKDLIMFSPPTPCWQRATIDQHFNGLSLIAEHRLLDEDDGVYFSTDTEPRRWIDVVGDGNCFFRSISFWLTGSQRCHKKVLI